MSQMHPSENCLSAGLLYPSPSWLGLSSLVCFRSRTRKPPSDSRTPSPESVFTLNTPAPVKLSHPAFTSSSSSPLASLSPPSWPLQAHLDSQPAFSLHEGQQEAPGALDVDPQPLQRSSPGNLRDLEQRLYHDVSTLTDLCSDLPELEIVSLLSEGQPNYTLRADSVFGYDNDDWLRTPLLPPEVVLGLTHEQIEETFKYFFQRGQVNGGRHDDRWLYSLRDYILTPSSSDSPAHTSGYTHSRRLVDTVYPNTQASRIMPETKPVSHRTSSTQ
ncbi:uncharacterized protein LOC127533301 [Acanthochromis polyacanthus]|uniref:uncharacterized protein LOC127533301 n=1 Tax=Acanthochromis polyacanthus TaxID=80966 RepID=UPI002233E595|nr:uncharacterized protein LOC127533301 [Acanthochromis polyacanthus]